MERLSDDDVAQLLSGARDWSRDGDAIVRAFDCHDFNGSVSFLNSILPVADELNHHPDVAIAWNVVTVTLSTHSAGGLTAADFELARRLDELTWHAADGPASLS